ncbi:molybdopterin-dependent oxidoreductase [Marinomonas sp. 2405UD68-3]|uniref:molybdopterin-dependent oxidoreductase n=1 Tax=Marinomonas sp. 2405UD68-3 TaxID=3391835 RepID=UPI0039C99A0D
MTLFIRTAFTIVFSFFSPSLFAGELVKPSGQVILTVMGNIDQTNQTGGKAEFNRSMIEKIGLRKRQTTTPWTEGVAVFEGVLVKDLLDCVGAKGTNLKITALNDYSANMPLTDLNKYDVILAMKQDGERLRIRGKGPIFVVYPFNEFPELNSEIIYNRSVWQVASITVE